MKKYWIILLFSLTGKISYACCTCIGGAEKFVDGIYHKSFTFMGEVIGHDSIVGGVYSDNKITILKVIKKYYGYGAFEVDTIKIMNSNGLDCIGYLPNDTLKAQYILRGFFEKIDDYNFETQKIKHIGLYLKIPICDSPIIEVNGNMATGKITKSGKRVYRKEKRRRKIYNWIEDKISYDLAQRYKKRYLDREFKYEQTMPLEKVERIIDSVFKERYPQVHN